VLNQPPWDKAAILIARHNFGCGSSREMVVWALMGTGVNCVIAPSFGEIFHNNCFKNVLLPVRLPEAAVEHLLHLASARPNDVFTVDLRDKHVFAPDGGVHAFDLLEYHRQALLNGQDEIEATLARRGAIRSFEQKQREAQPWLGLAQER
jgi:3-isopropylmalate/(R)-2-methylmalate dehydratase small subunit